MGGLLRRALDFRKRISLDRPQRGAQPLVDDESGITEEEREKILEQIDDLVAKDRIALNEDSFSFRSQKNSATLPIMINVIALVVIAGGALLLSFLFNRQETAIVQQSKDFVSTESRLIEALKKESQEKLQAKEQEISSIQHQLSQIDNEREQLQAQYADRIAEQEREFQQKLQQALEEERASLQDQGLSEEEIATRLQSLEQSKEQEYASQVEEIQIQAQRELDAREEEFEQLEQQYRNELVSAQEERQQLERALAEREAELREEYEAETRLLEEEKAGVSAQLERIREQERKEQLILDQINSYYGRINEYIRDGNYDQAIGSLETLEKYIRQPSLEVLPAIVRRREADFLTIEAFTTLLRNELTLQGQQADEANRALDLLEAVRQRVDRADGLLNAGRIQEAKNLYTAAIADIPVIQQGYEKLLSIEENAAAGRLRRIEETIDRGDDLYNRGLYTQAVSTYREALTSLSIDSQSAQQIINRTMEAGYLSRAPMELEIKDREIVSLEARISEQDRLLQDRDERIAENNRLIQNQSQQIFSLRRRIQELETTKTALEGELYRTKNLLSQAEQTVAERTRELQAGERSLQELRQNYQKTNDELSTVRRELARTEQSLASTRNSLASAKEELSRMNTDLSAARKTLTSTQEELTAAISDLSATQRELDETRSDLSSTRQQLTDARSDLSSKEQQLANMERRYTTAQTALSETTTQLETTREELASVRSDLLDANRLVEKNQRALTEREQEKAQLRQQIAEQRQELDRMKRQLSTVQEKREYLLDQITRLQGNGVVTGAEQDENIINAAPEQGEGAPVQANGFEAEAGGSGAEAENVASGTDSVGRTSGTDSVVSMLSTKLRVKQVLGSEPVRSQFPTLYEDLETYLQALEEQKSDQGKITGLEDAKTVISMIQQSLLKSGDAEQGSTGATPAGSASEESISTGSPSEESAPEESTASLETIWERYDSERERQILRTFLTNLSVLLET